MSILLPYVNDGSMPRTVQPGDNVAGAEILPADLAGNAQTITGQLLSQSLIARTSTGAAADTIDSAANIINAIGKGLGFVGVQNGTTWRTRWIQRSAFAITVAATANTGVTVVNGTVNASSVKEFLVSVINGTPAQSYAGNTTNASAVITGLTSEQTKNLTTGMVVTNAVAGLQGTTILSVQPGVGVTLSGNANATAAGSQINFSPVVRLDGLGQGLL